ncbi:MAG TPA: FecR domain-containing protein [Pseudobdellovibrionaceae bacterium]|nr:FecR domain-containing protein [Pseudobdellovibrionaceae bacterium]
MRSQWKRLGIAALLSLSCAGATLLWYRMTESRIDLAGVSPLAQVSSVDDEVLRRPSTRLLWLPVNTGDNLYTGETIRTSSRGELQIQLVKGGSIKLEPDSLIVLQESKGQISLDLMEGSLFVDAKKDQSAQDASSPKLVLNSKSGQVDLSGVSASMSKGSGGGMDLQVLEGTAKIQGADGQQKEISSGKTSSFDANGALLNTSNWKILSPSTSSEIYVDVDAEKPVVFKWQGLSANLAVTLHAGETKKSMREIATAAPGVSELAVKLPLGKYWWKLVAKDPQNQIVAEKNAASRLEILARRVPAVTFPLADALIPMDRVPAAVTFQWEKLEPGIRLQLEVGTDPSFSRKLVTKTFQSEEQMVLPNLKEGTYYWRMSASYQGDSKPFVGKVQKFTLEHPSAKEPAQIAWTLPSEKFVQNYALEPVLELQWESRTRQNEIGGFRVRLENQEDPSLPPQQLEAKTGSLKAKLPKGGRYLASIEAYNKDGSVIGRSSQQILTAQELPLLNAPNFLPADGPLQSGFDGRTELQWQAIPGAKGYTLTVQDKTGKQLAKKTYNGLSANLQNLMPGEYSVRLEAVDNWGRSGAGGEARTLIVPDRSNL